MRLERRSHESLYRASSSRSRFSCDSGASSAPATLFCPARRLHNDIGVRTEVSKVLVSPDESRVRVTIRAVELLEAQTMGKCALSAALASMPSIEALDHRTSA